MKKQTKNVIYWTIIALVAFIVIILLKNMDAFINGFSMGGNMAE